MSEQAHPQWPLRYEGDGWWENVQVTYRGIEVATLARSGDGYPGGWAKFHPTGAEAYDTNWRRLRQWVRQQAQAMDLYTWWGVHVGAKEG